MCTSQKALENRGTLTIRIHRAQPTQKINEAQTKRRKNPFAEKQAANKFLPSIKYKRWIQDYHITASRQDSLLDCLLTIKRTQDPSLTFRYACGHGMCGSDGVIINGQPGLLCKSLVKDHAQSHFPSEASVEAGSFRSTTKSKDERSRSQDFPTGINTEKEQNFLGYIELAPLNGFPVERDLVVNTGPMFQQIRTVNPYLISDRIDHLRPADQHEQIKEHLQTPDQLKEYESYSNCISCGVCEGVCPIYVADDAFIGPATLVSAARFIYDSRDAHSEDRLEAINDSEGIQACQSVRACSRFCPQGIDVGEAIWQLIEKAQS